MIKDDIWKIITHYFDPDEETCAEVTEEILMAMMQEIVGALNTAMGIEAE